MKRITGLLLSVLLTTTTVEAADTWPVLTGMSSATTLAADVCADFRRNKASLDACLAATDKAITSWGEL